MNNILRLNLGCGPDIKEGYVNIDTCPIDDRVVKMDIRDLNYSQGSVDEIYAKDILEHLSLDDAKKSIKNWSFICKSGGQLFIQTICWDSIIQAYYANVWDIETVNYMLFSGRNWVDGKSRNEDFHKSAYSAKLLSSILNENNFQINDIKFDVIDEPLLRNPMCHNLNIFVKASKK